MSVLSLVHNSPTECYVYECDHEALVMRRPWPTETVILGGADWVE